MKIVCASDTHGWWDQLDYPEGDVLVLTGDILKDYGFDTKFTTKRQLTELASLNGFVKELKSDGKFKEVVIIAGNHDFVYQTKNEEARSQIKDAIYLQDEEVIIDGVKFYGSPWQPWYGGMAFNLPCADKAHGGNFLRYKAHAKKCWGKIPDDTQVLLTHGPPLGILDKNWLDIDCGDQFLLERIDQLSKLKLHVFGHIHSAHGITSKKGGGPLFVNAAICGKPGSGAVQEPRVVSI